MNKIKELLSNVYLIDKILILYMIILLIYTAIHLFNSGTMGESTNVDTIIRTSSSAIFGYFISNNFIKSDSGISPDTTTGNSEKGKSNETQKEIQKNDLLKNQDIEKAGESNPGKASYICCNSLQIIIVSSIGLISLICLFVSRNFTQITPEFSATVSQLRDFLSACIGFLVSCGKTK